MPDLNQIYWNNRYEKSETRWDLGTVSPPIAAYINQLTDKNVSILIPGCGNTYEADYLLQKGFTNITVLDIAPRLVEKLQEKHSGNPKIKVTLGDFFEHQGKYDLIIEQTFFCAISPTLRPLYAQTMHRLLRPNGILVGVLFNRLFETEGPPFGGFAKDYQAIFAPYFTFRHFETCYNSHPARQDSEIFIVLQGN